jgi:hypothetical protein
LQKALDCSRISHHDHIPYDHRRRLDPLYISFALPASTLIPADMTIVQKIVPYHLIGMQDGDAVLGFQLLAGRVLFQVASLKEETKLPEPVAPQPAKKLGDWGRKWAGAVTLSPGEKVEDLRDAAMAERFGP